MIKTRIKMPVKIHVWATKHKGNDVWKAAIDGVGPGPLTELKTRYTRRHGAAKGGARSIGGYPVRWFNPRTLKYVTRGWKTQDGRDIVFVYSAPPKVKKPKKK